MGDRGRFFTLNTNVSICAHAVQCVGFMRVRAPRPACALRSAQLTAIHLPETGSQRRPFFGMSDFSMDSGTGTRLNVSFTCRHSARAHLLVLLRDA